MAICRKCGNEFEEWEAESIFESYDKALPVDFEYFEGELCGECAYEEYANGNYFEECSECGKRFYPEDEHNDFQAQVSFRVLDADMYDEGILCADCAAAKLFASLEDDNDDNDDDDDNEEGLSVYDAAVIWASHGKDEDHTFGYSEEELEDAL